jgi:hypothetical protein
VKEKTDYKAWEKDLKTFLEAEAVEPPPEVSKKLLARVEQDLNPSPWTVFVKLSLIGSLAGLATLLICPQLGLGKSIGVMAYFMKLGPIFCRAACGAFFMSVAILSSVLLLRPEELRVLHRTAFLQVSVFSLCTLAGLVCLGPEVLTMSTLLWILGGIVGGLATFELGYVLRLKIIKA